MDMPLMTNDEVKDELKELIRLTYELASVDAVIKVKPELIPDMTTMNEINTAKKKRMIELLDKFDLS